MGDWHPQHEESAAARLLEPTEQLRQLEADGDYTARLALLEEQKCLPWQAAGDVLPAS